jgi:hypothetical protein
MSSFESGSTWLLTRDCRAFLDEWAYARLWTSDASRARALDPWLHRYNHHRHHTAIGGPPASRVTNLAGHNS